MAEKYLSKREVANRLAISEDTVTRMIRKAGKAVGVIRAGKQPRIPESKLAELGDVYARGFKKRGA